VPAFSVAVTVDTTSLFNQHPPASTRLSTCAERAQTPGPTPAL